MTELKQKPKSWIWYLTWPFAHANYTTIWNTIYYPKDYPPGPKTKKHEKIHSIQQHRWTLFGLPLWIFLYLGTRYNLIVLIILAVSGNWQEALMLSPILALGLPVLWNPWRWRWEWEAYRKGSGYSIDYTFTILRSLSYGWLIFHRKGK